MADSDGFLAKWKKQLFSFSNYHPTLIYSIYNYFMNPAPPEFRRRFREDLQTVRANPGPYKITEYFTYNAGNHPANYIDYECAFAANHLTTRKPETVLDIGSYRLFLLGLLAHYKVITVDVRDRPSLLVNEKVLTGDAKKLPMPEKSVDAIVSLCSLEHFGLGRYGDALDLDADRKACEEMKRVLKPGGALILSTQITRGQPSIAFNAGRAYSRDILHGFFSGMRCVEEKYFSHELLRFCAYDEITDCSDMSGIYLGCWEK